MGAFGRKGLCFGRPDCPRGKTKLKNGLKLSWLILVLLFGGVPYAKADHEWITVPVGAADYYGWAYTEAFCYRGFRRRIKIFQFSRTCQDRLSHRDSFMGDRHGHQAKSLDRFGNPH